MLVWVTKHLYFDWYYLPEGNVHDFDFGRVCPFVTIWWLDHPPREL